MKKSLLASLFALILATTVQSFSQLREYPDESLTGVKAVHVVVHYEAPNEAAYGLTEKDLQDAVEERLAADDVSVLDEASWSKEPGEPCFFVNVVGTQVDTEGKTFAYSFSADFIQKVMLGRNSSFKTEGATWSQGYFLVVPYDRLSNVTLQISDVAHDFAGSLHEANKTLTQRR